MSFTMILDFVIATWNN